MLKFQIIVQKFQRRIRVSCVAQHHLAQHTPHSGGVYHIWFPSNQIPVILRIRYGLRTGHLNIDRGEAARFQKLPTSIKRQYDTIVLRLLSNMISPYDLQRRTAQLRLL